MEEFTVDKKDQKNKQNGGAVGESQVSYIDLLKEKLAEETAKKQGKPVVEEQKKEKKQKEPETKPVDDLSPDWKESIKNEERSKKVNKVKEETKKEGSVAKRLGVIALSIVLALVLIVGGYFAFLQMSFSRIEDSKYLEVESNQANRLLLGNTYSISTFNLGFGAYSQTFSFFMDEGETLDGVKTKGKNARAFSEDDVRNNINGAISLVSGANQSDFYFFQEVDTSSTRSHFVDQKKMIQNAFVGYSSSFAVNAHSEFLFYPLSEPIGTMNSGIMTLSKYNVDYSIRRRLEISNGMIDKLFDLDRCFMVSKLPITGSGEGSGTKYLVLINVHLSAYDEGDIRQKQIAMLYDYINYEYNTNKNYVVVGGDFNLLLAGEDGLFNNNMKTPGWCQSLPSGYEAKDFANIGFSINYDLSTTVGTCRDSSVRYVEGSNLEVIIDGFMTSANITVKKTETIDGEFKNSDHNPVRMEFVIG